MSDSTPLMMVTPLASELEATLAQLQGVLASRVVMNSNREPIEIHIVAYARRKPKQIIRDVETLLLVKHGLRVDYRRISLVQLEDEDLLRLPLARPEIREVLEEDLGDQKRVRVEIQGAGRIVHGEARERVDQPSLLQTAALATVECVERLLGHQVDVRLENATMLRLDSREIALVILTCVFQGREETFVGASFVGTRPAEAAARATLDALNRRLFTLAPRS